MSLLFDLFKDQIEKKFKNTIFLSAIGARTCYNKNDICYLFEQDNRIIDNESRAEFLNKLGFQYYHTSVFAHTFGYFEVKNLTYSLLSKYFDDFGNNLWFKYGSYYDVNNEKSDLNKILAALLAAKYFKSVWIPNTNIIGLSLRHFIEDAYNFKNDEAIKYIKNMFYNSEYVEDEIYKKYYNDFKKHKRKVLPIYVNKNEYYGWCVFAIQDVSRTMTHQLVRHTKLNYSQRSQRYVDEQIVDYYNNLFITPETIKENNKANKIFEDLKYKSFETYKQLRNLKIPKEDARFALLEASKTSIIISGTYEDFKDFINKRKIKQAQWEIRNITKEIEEILNK